ncbi:MAG: hypothetical protein JSV51_04890 [Candidatus Bathyarchaeota archaeon]|nr:MAG: hypothetical protein JSV51_04890 [Candidatus Bathyarchaeota archaeon]
MRSRSLLGVLLTACLVTAFIAILPPVSADNLVKTDFQKESFSKTVDYFDYARAWALLHGLPVPSNHWHAYVYMTYINKMGLKILYTGLRNISLANQAYLTIPMQTLLMHFKTGTSNRDALVSSSFLMVMGFNDTTQSIYTDSPDRNDTLWASFSFGLNLNQLFNSTFPAFNSKSEVFPLTSSEDGLVWKWGMKYTNLTALWITTHITEGNETNPSRPWGLAMYDELTFNYTLTIDPDTHTATIHQDYAIGRMRNLWIFGGWLLFIPIYNHYNSTGCYAYGKQLSNQTIYDFLQEHNVKMSIVNFQTSVMIDRTTYSTSASGQNVTGKEVFVSNSSISTYADDGEKIFDAAFGTKNTYNLFNYTADPTESTYQTYNASTRTTEISGYAKNRDLFGAHRKFSQYLPLILANMYPNLYQKAKENIANMTKADCLYLISYPNYSGYRIEHDPVYTIYFAPTTGGPNSTLGTLIVLGIVAGIIIAISAVILKRKGSKKPSLPPTGQSTPPSPPPTI